MSGRCGIETLNALHKADRQTHHANRRRARACSSVVGSSLASDENRALNFPHKFAPLPLSRPSCGTYHPSAPSDAPSNCQDSAHTPAGRSTTRSPLRSLESGLKACAALPNELQQRDQCRPLQFARLACRGRQDEDCAHPCAGLSLT